MDKENALNKIQDYLLQVNLPFDTHEDGLWVIHDEFDNVDNIVVYLQETRIIFRVKLMEVPSANKEKFFETLLWLNANSLIHGAYGLEDNHVVIVDTLEVENLDLNEFLASVDSMVMAISQDYKKLSQFLNK